MHMALGLANRVGAEVENRCSQDRGRMAISNSLAKVVERTDTTRRDYRHTHGIGNRPGQFQVIAGLLAILIH